MILERACQETDPVNDPYWNDIRNHDYSTSFPAIKDFIHKQSPNGRRRNNRTKYFTWVIAVLLPLMIFFSCKRKTYIEPEGATLSFIAKDSVQLTLEFTLQQYVEKKWSVVFRSHAGTIHGTIQAPGESYPNLKTLSEKLKMIPGVAELYLSAVQTTVKESRLSRLSYKIFNRHVDAVGASNEQLLADIRAKLRETGLHNMNVQLLEENGKRQVKFIPTGNSRDFSIDLTLRDGSTVSAIAEKW
jgi:hypothetical protein